MFGPRRDQSETTARPHFGRKKDRRVLINFEFCINCWVKLFFIVSDKFFAGMWSQARPKRDPSDTKVRRQFGPKRDIRVLINIEMFHVVVSIPRDGIENVVATRRAFRSAAASQPPN